jgi:hypothetical protein
LFVSGLGLFSLRSVSADRSGCPLRSRCVFGGPFILGDALVFVGFIYLLVSSVCLVAAIFPNTSNSIRGFLGSSLSGGKFFLSAGYKSV